MSEAVHSTPGEESPAATDPLTQSPATVPLPPTIGHTHRDVQGGVARAVVFGANDGLLSNVALILGVAGAGLDANSIRLTGLAGVMAGAVSMGIGEYISMRAQSELFERELELERIELKRNPHVEQVELALIYEAKGVEADTARAVSEQLMRDPERALDAHAREELGIDPSNTGSPLGAAFGSFFSFSAGALLPVIPWFIVSGNAGLIATLFAGFLGACAIGLLLATFTGRPKLFSAARSVLFVMSGAAITYGAGRIFGVATG